MYVQATGKFRNMNDAAMWFMISQYFFFLNWFCLFHIFIVVRLCSFFISTGREFVFDEVNWKIMIRRFIRILVK